MKDYYQVLEVGSDATREEIRGQYKQLVRVYHPDRFSNGSDKVYAEQKLKEIIEAYHALSATEESIKLSDRPQSITQTPPKPVVSREQIDFGSVEPGSRSTEKVEIDNKGGVAHQLHFIYSEPNSWFRVTRGQRLHADKPVPIEVEIAIDTTQLEPEKSYQGWIDINMDDASTRLELAVELTPAPARFRPSSRLVLSTFLTVISLVAIIVAVSLITLPGMPTNLGALWLNTPSQGLSSSSQAATSGLAFSVDEQYQQTLYISRQSNGTQVTQKLTGQTPSWSSVDDQIAYVAEAAGAPQIFVALLESPAPGSADSTQVQNSQKRQLTNSPESKQMLRWSPTGRLLAYIAGDAYADAPSQELHIIDVASGRIQILTNRQQGSVTHFAWSPNGTTLLITMQQGDEERIYQIHIIGMVDLNTSQAEPFTHFNSRHATWSPDGTEIVVASDEGLFITDIDGSNIRQLTEQAAWLPNWAPNGLQLAFLTQPKDVAEEVSPADAARNQAELWVVDRSGQTNVQVAQNGPIDHKWSPDGEWLAFTTGNVQVQPPVLYLWMTSAGSEPQLIAEVNDPTFDWIHTE